MSEWAAELKRLESQTVVQRVGSSSSGGSRGSAGGLIPSTSGYVSSASNLPPPRNTVQVRACACASERVKFGVIVSVCAFEQACSLTRDNLRVSG
jgi:hypothetical protein